jgi:hypothetical protein
MKPFVPLSKVACIRHLYLTLSMTGNKESIVAFPGDCNELSLQQDSTSLNLPLGTNLASSLNMTNVDTSTFN